MKKVLTFMLIACIMLISAVMIYASNGTDELSIVLRVNVPIMSVNGVQQSIDDNGTTPLIINSRTLIPIRAVAEAMGSDVSWDSESREVKLLNDEKEVVLTINSTNALLSGNTIKLDVAPIIINGRTMFPVRFIAESFGYTVNWNSYTSEITISGERKNVISAPIDNDEVNTEGENILIAYYSLTDIIPKDADVVTSATPCRYNTETAANIIHDNIGGDLFKISTENTYPVSHSEASKLAKEELDNDYRPILTNHINNMDDYDVIFVGYPIWHQRTPMAVRSFLEEYDFSGKTIVPFCTALGSGISESVKDIETLCPNSVILDGVSLSTEDSNMVEDIADWLDKINLNDVNFNIANKVNKTPVTLTIGDKTFNAVLNETTAAKDLISRLPVTVELFNSDNDYCGGITPPLEYEEDEVQHGYKNGDLAFWTAGDDFVIFVKDEELSANTGDLVIIGNIVNDIDKLQNLDGTIDVLIDLVR